jgi:galactokinase
VEVATAPGRINLIGEHTDYNNGFVFPMAIDRGVWVAAAPRADGVVCVHSRQFGQTHEFRPEELSPGGARGWQAYVEGVLWSLLFEGLEFPGLDLLIDSDLIRGAGLSSSAALELAVARVAFAVAVLPWDAQMAAHAAQRAEREYVGVPCGIMDQFAATLSREGHAILLDCRSLSMSYVAVPDGVSFVVLDSGTRRELGDSVYSARVAECERAVAAVARRFPGVRSLRDVSFAMLEACADTMDSVARKRAGHVLSEMMRPHALAGAFSSADLRFAGELFRASHASLRNEYDVSSPELDYMVECAERHDSCYGARLTGAGFGGCVIAMVARGSEREFIDETLAGYRARCTLPAAGFAVRASEGARAIVA